MPSHWIIFLIIVPMSAGVATLLFTGRRIAQRGIGVAALLVNLLLSLWALFTVYRGPDQPGGFLVSQMGDWPAPFGITLVVDPLAAIMLVVTALVLLGVFVYCIGQLPGNVQGGFFHPLFHLLSVGVQWSFLTGDLFNLFVAFEIMLMASYVLLIVGTSAQQMRQAYKYILLNLLASLLFVTAAGLVYGHTGTLNLADLARMNHAGLLPNAANPAFAMLLLVFGLKTAIFPLWFWLPDTYHTVPAAIGGLFAGLLTKVGAYVMLRIFVMTLGSGDGVADVLRPPILASAAVTMFLGVLGAVSMNSIRRILSIHIISQVGYMILGVGLAIVAGATLEQRELAVAGTIFFIVHNMVVKTSLFLCGGLMQQHAGSDELSKMGGLIARTPWLATLFILAALSLAGLPPLSGFFGKWVLVRQSFVMGYGWLAAVALVTSLLTLLSMLKIWSYGFWSEPQRAAVASPRIRLGMAATAMLVLVALSMGLGANTYYALCRGAARSLVDPQPYVQAVLGDGALVASAAEVQP